MYSQPHLASEKVYGSSVRTAVGGGGLPRAPRFILNLRVTGITPRASFQVQALSWATLAWSRDGTVRTRLAARGQRHRWGQSPFEPWSRVSQGEEPLLFTRTSGPAAGHCSTATVASSVSHHSNPYIASGNIKCPARHASTRWFTDTQVRNGIGRSAALGLL